jgi:RNA polymerase sigma factor (sigma-70 family)
LVGGERCLEVSDLELIEDCLNGNKDKFSELVNRYKKLIYSVVYNMINDKQEINDISQEVFVRIYKALDRYNPEYKFSTWSVKIATNYCLDVLRKKKAEFVPIDDMTDISSDADTPEATYIKKERKFLIHKALLELPDKYRIPIVLYHQNGLSYEEMSEVLNEPMSIIKNRLYRARLILREKLAIHRKEEVL